jgi:peptidoglycan/LPS O-acetylase OafA/YrhL
MSTRRIDWLDAIRGLAALMVLVMHYFHIALIDLLPVMVNDPRYVLHLSEHDTLWHTLECFRRYHLDVSALRAMAPFIWGYWDLGKIGVLLFFLLSGMVIPYSLFKSEQPVQRFVIGRFFRLYPLYWLSIALILLLKTVLIPVNWTTILVNYTMFQQFVGLPDINPVAWTLQIELIFYGVCALLFAFGALKSYRANLVVIGALWLLSLLLAVFRMEFSAKAPIAVPMGLSLMLIGYLWRKWLLKEECIPGWVMLALGGVYCLLIPVVSLMGYGELGWMYLTTYLLAPLLFILLTTVVRLRLAGLLFLGRISYSLYLLHGVVGAYLLPRLVPLLKPFYSQSSLFLLLPCLLSFGVSTLISAAAYYGVEIPCIRLGKHWGELLLQKRLRVAASEVTG